MALIKCKECGAEISAQAKTCPKCGAPVKKPMPKGCLITLIVGAVLFLIIFIISSIEDSDFEQVGYYKTKLRNGSYFRLFSVYTSSTNWEKMKKYAQNQMWSEGGSTFVFFFNDRKNTPDVTQVGMKFNKKYERYWIAGYWKYPTGKEKFAKFTAKK